MFLAQGPQRSDSGEARTRGPSVSSQALYHLPCKPGIVGSYPGLYSLLDEAKPWMALPKYYLRS